MAGTLQCISTRTSPTRSEWSSGRIGPPSLALSKFRRQIPFAGLPPAAGEAAAFPPASEAAELVPADPAATADAAATVIANAVNLPDHRGITRVPACEISPDSDLGDLLVTRGVELLSDSEIAAALDSGVRVAETLRAQGLIHSSALCLQGHTRVVSPLLPRTFIVLSQRSLLHA